MSEFAKKGVSGARVDQIAERAGANKQLIYHYFGSKDGLYKMALERAFLAAREGDEAFAATAAQLDPLPALRAFIEYMCRTTWATNDFQRLVFEDALNNAVHLRELESVPIAYGYIVGVLNDILVRGAEAGVFRPKVDPKDLYISLVGMFGIRYSNGATLSISLTTDLASPRGFARSIESCVDFVLAALRP